MVGEWSTLTRPLLRGVQALEAVHALLERIERRLAGLDPATLRHLGPLRAAAEELLEGQEERLDALVERAAPTRTPGRRASTGRTACTRAQGPHRTGRKTGVARE